jgi:hypothetical protein
MNKKVKRDMPGSTPPFACRPQSYAARSLMALSIRQGIILPEIICFRKVA